jgi:hypothetical protein
MSPLDAVCIALYTIILGSLKTRDSLAVLIAFSVSVLYTSSTLFELHSAVINHIVVSLSFIPFIYFLSKPVCLSVLGYVLYHWLIAGDYLLTDKETILSMTFSIVSPSINVIIMVSLIYAGINNKYRTNLNLGGGWFSHLLRNKRHANKVEE